MLYTGLVFIAIALVEYLVASVSVKKREYQGKKEGWNKDLIGSCRGVFECVLVHI